MIFIDTNYFLRFLLNDISEQHLIVEALFMKASEGKEQLITSTIVFFELYWVLDSYYGQSKQDIVDVLEKILRLTFIELTEREQLFKSLQLFKHSSLDLEDCYNLMFAKGQSVDIFGTFDKKLEREFNKLK